MGRDGREIARDNEEQVLTLASRLGWLRAIDAAWAVWPKASSKQAMAQRTLRRLVSAGELAPGTMWGGIPVYALRLAGVRRLAALGIEARAGNSVIKGARTRHAPHRALGNEFLIWRSLVGLAGGVFFEREIATGEAGLLPNLPKVPDGLITYDNGFCVWVEVERAYKKRADHRHLVRHLLRLAGNDYPVTRDYAADRALVVGQPADFRRILHALERLEAQGHPEAIRLLDDPNALSFAQRRGPYEFATGSAAQWALAIERGRA